MPIPEWFKRCLPCLLSGALLVFFLAGASSAADPPQRGGAASDSETVRSPPSVGVALGAGGASGLAHIPMLEALDEMGVKPRCLAGSSIGAVIGALYASGMTGAQIRKLAKQFDLSPEGATVQGLSEEASRWFDLVDVELGRGGVLSSEDFMAFLYDQLKRHTFEELEIPLKVVAADLWNREEVVLQSGPLIPAIKASMAIPGVFQPVALGGRVLVDGGTVNPVPYDLLTSECDVVLGVDVIGERTPPEGLIPSYFEAIFSSIKVMQHAIMTEKRRRQPIRLYITPPIVDVRALEFYRAEEVFEQAGPAKQELKRRLAKLLRER